MGPEAVKRTAVESDVEDYDQTHGYDYHGYDYDYMGQHQQQQFTQPEMGQRKRSNSSPILPGARPPHSDQGVRGVGVDALTGAQR